MTRIQWKRIGILCLVACMCFGMLASCKGKKGSEQASTPGLQGEGPATFTVQVLTEGGMAIKDIGVYVYEDETLGEMVTFAKTDKDGKIQFEAPIQEGYTVVLKDVPQGYALEEKYILKSLETQIVLKAELVAVEDLENVTFKLGDVMSELEVTTYDGKTYVLSELLKVKEMVLLNFWYLGCTPCKMEFPHLQKAYEQYSDKMEILALNPVDGDDASLKAYAEDLGLTFPMATCDQGWQKAMKLVAYPTSVVIDRYGVISFIYQGYFEDAQSVEDVFAYFTAEDYEQGIVRELDEILTGEKDDEDEIQNPTEVGGVTSFQLTVKAGETVYCDLYRVDGMYLQIKSANAVLENQGKRYEPKNGVIGLVVHCKDTRTPTQIGLTNTGKETETYTITLGALVGTLNNPYTMSLGEFDVSIPAGSEQGVYYRYIAQEDGMLTLRCLKATAGVPYDFTLYNLNSYANRTLESDSVKDKDGNTVVQIKVKKGQVVQFSPSALPDDSGSYPAVQMKFSAYMDASAGAQEEEIAKKIYAITVTDEKRTPMKNVKVTFTNEKGEIETQNSNEKGVAALELPEGNYKAVVRLPSGYKAKTTSFTLTVKQPTVSIKLEKIPEIVYKDYIVKAVDEAGKALEGVLVTIDQSFGTTDASGTVKLNLPEGEYTAVIAAPDGYTIDQMSHPFGDKTEITVSLKKDDGTGTGPDETKVEYSVKVTDYSGKGMENVTVRFLKDGQPAGMKMVNANGLATLRLEKGTYTISLSFASGKYYYDPSKVTVTEAAPSLIIQVAQEQKDEYVTTYGGEGDNYYKLELGTTYLTGMQADTANYYVVKPTQSGVYRIAVSDPNAVVTYRGAGSFFFDGKNSKETGFIEEEMREEMVGGDQAIYISVTGTESCLIHITRTDVILTEEEKAEWIIYSGKTMPSSSNVKTGTMEYFNLGAKTSDYKLVMGADGFYHLGSATGKLVYVNLGANGRYNLSFWSMLGREQAGGTGMKAAIYDEKGNFVRKEDYTEWLQNYLDCLNTDGSGFYPLNADLEYILKNLVGEHGKGWGDPDRTYDFAFSGVTNYNEELGWLFNCGTLK